MPWYKSGTVSVTQNSNAVMGTGTAFLANCRVGDAFRGPDGAWYEVINIASDTAMAIAPNYQGATNAAGVYAIAPMQGYVKDSADALRALVNTYGPQLAALGTTGNYEILPIEKGGTGSEEPTSDFLLEGLTNKFFTSARSIGSLLTGLVLTDEGSVSSTDSVLTGIGKLQKQVAAAVKRSGDTLSGALNQAPIVSVASSVAPAIGAAAANTITITGTTGITGFDSIASGAVRTLVFAGVVTLTHNEASLILPNDANITTAAGDVLQFTSLGGGVWKCTSFMNGVLAARITNLESSIGFAIIYPNGGTESSPANISRATRYSMANPFPNSRVLCKPEILISGKWLWPGWYTDNSGGSRTYFVSAEEYDNTIVIQTGSTGLATWSTFGGSPNAQSADVINPTPCRVLVYKVKG